MAIRSFSSRAGKALISLSHISGNHKPRHRLVFFSSTSQHPDHPPPLTELVNEISRVLSDHRSPHHDLEAPLNAYSAKISTDLVEQVLKRCKNLGFSAHRFFLWAKRVPRFEHSERSFHILIDVLGSSRQFALLWDLLIESREYKSFEIKPEVFRIIFRAYSRADLPNDAIRAFNRMPEFGIKPTIHDLDQLLLSLCKRKHVKHAKEFYEKVKFEFVPSAKTYSILIRGLGDTRDASGARNLFDEMLERNCPIDLLACNSLLDSLCKSGHVDEAYSMFQEMCQRGINPDAYTYSVFIHAYCEANDIHSVFRVLDRMRRYDLVPNVFTYNHVIKTLCKHEKLDDAYSLLNEMIMRGNVPDTWSYNAIMAYHCEHSEVNKALRLMSKMNKNQCPPDRHTYNMVLKLLIRVGRFDRASEIWDGMWEGGFQPSVSTYSVMVHGLIKKKGKLEEACKYFETMIDEGIPPYESTVETIRNHLIGRGLVDMVDVIVSKMERSSSRSIQDMAKLMRSERRSDKPRNEELEELESDE